MKGYFSHFFLDYGRRDLKIAKPWECSPALPRSMSWKYLKVSIFSFLLWLFCNQRLQRATQLFEFSGAKRRVIKKIPKTRWFGDLRASKASHLHSKVKPTFTTWKSLAPNGLGSQGNHDCTRMSHASPYVVLSLPLEIHSPTPESHCTFPTFSVGQLETSSYGGPSQVFVCCLLCADFPLSMGFWSWGAG